MQIVSLACAAQLQDPSTRSTKTPPNQPLKHQKINGRKPAEHEEQGISNSFHIQVHFLG